MSSSLMRPAIGEPAPPIRLSTPDGHLWQLADQRGQHVVIIFHRHIH